MWRPAGFNENQPSAFDYAIGNRPDVGKIMMTADDGNSLLKQTGYEQEANSFRKGLMGLTSGLERIDNARVNATRQQNASQAGLMSAVGDTIGGLAGGLANKFKPSSPGPFNNGGVGSSILGNLIDNFGGGSLYRNPYE